MATVPKGRAAAISKMPTLSCRALGWFTTSPIWRRSSLSPAVGARIATTRRATGPENFCFRNRKEFALRPRCSASGRMAPMFSTNRRAARGCAQARKASPASGRPLSGRRPATAVGVSGRSRRVGRRSGPRSGATVTVQNATISREGLSALCRSARLKVNRGKAVKRSAPLTVMAPKGRGKARRRLPTGRGRNSADRPRPRSRGRPLRAAVCAGRFRRAIQRARRSAAAIGGGQQRVTGGPKLSATTRQATVARRVRVVARHAREARGLLRGGRLPTRGRGKRR